MRIIHFNEIDSTNEYAKRNINKLEDGTIILADKQTKGRGRFLNKWYSPEGGLYFSLIKNKIDNFNLTHIIGGLGVCDAIKSIGIQAYIKWPNDIIVGDKKISGILIEVEERKIIIGVGINLNIQHFPQELNKIATSVYLETQKYIDKHEFLKLIIKNIDNNYQKEKNILLEEYRKESIVLGRWVKIYTNNEIIYGIAKDIHKDGALILNTEAGDKKIISGRLVWI